MEPSSSPPPPRPSAPSGAPAEPADDELVARAAAGERAAFAELVARHGGGLRAVLAASVRDEHRAEDLAQEVWIKVFGALPRFRPRGSVRSWLFSIALNHLRDDARRRAVRERHLVLVDDGERPEPAAEPTAPEAERRDEQRRVRRALARVDEPFRTALALVELAGCSYAEAAAGLGCSVGTVKSRVHRGRRAFRDAWLRADPAPSLTPAPGDAAPADWPPSGIEPGAPEDLP